VLRRKVRRLLTSNKNGIWYDRYCAVPALSSLRLNPGNRFKRANRFATAIFMAKNSDRRFSVIPALHGTVYPAVFNLKQ